MRLVHHHDIPLHRTQPLGALRGKGIGRNQDSRFRIGIGEAFLLQLSRALRVHNRTGQIELVLQFALPLLAKRGGANDQNLPFALGPELAHHKPGFNRLSKPHFVRQQRAL